ncbi:hypothetical protein D0869_02703 [Hortaea werneckii]|uniref:Uncharacterized protein n=1 Tax=Hortaea werneckii TaxID=91943 RepID=A0A3M6X7Y1_HORWE|nr:hypothetical protein D0869_02703 [Hortaea werneckii]RMY25746.1 hypothetical protein D0867_00517 [Hortaea werneckii]
MLSSQDASLSGTRIAGSRSWVERLLRMFPSLGPEPPAAGPRPGPNLIDPQPREPGNGSTFKSPNRPCPPKPVQPRDDGCSRIPNACFTNGGNDDPQPRDLGNGRRMRKDPQPRDPGNGQHALIDDDGGCEVQAARVNSMMVMSNEPTTRVVGLLLE